MNRFVFCWMFLFMLMPNLLAQSFRYVASQVTTQPSWLTKLVVDKIGDAGAQFAIIIRSAY